MKDSFDKARDIAQVVATIAVPVVLAIGGWSIQAALKEQEIQRDYLRMAIDVLASPNSANLTRAWAEQVLARNSPVPMSSTVAEALAKDMARIVALPPGAAADELRSEWMRKPPASRP